MKRKSLILYLVLIIFLIGCQGYTIIGGNDINYPPINPMPKGNEVSICLFYPKNDEDALVKETRTVNLENQNLEAIVIKELLKGTNKKDLKNIIPNETEMLSIDTKDNIVYVSFNKSLIKEELDEKDEVLIVYSIVNSLTSLKDIDKVQILIEGEIKEIFNNYYKINEPIEFSSLIVEAPYASPKKTVEEYYYNILSGNYMKAYEMEFSRVKRDASYGMLKPYYQTTYKGFTNYNITNYEIIKYDKASIILLDIDLHYQDGNVSQTRWREIHLEYDEDRFKIDQKFEDTITKY